MQRSWAERTFGSMEQGSIRLSILTLVNTAVGAGMLSLSSSISKFGYILGSMMFFIAAGNLYMGLYCFKYLMYKYQDTKIYSDLVKELLGKKIE